MKTSTIFVFSFLLTILFSQTSFAQNVTDPQTKITELEAQKENVREREKEKLKEKITHIEERVANDEISVEKAEALKAEAIKRNALNIEDQMKMIDLNIGLIERNQNTEEENYTDAGCILTNTDTSKPKGPKFGTYFGAGVNTVLIENSSLDPYKTLSFNWEIGFYLQSYLSKKNKDWRLNYGLAFQWKDIDIKGNNILIDDGNGTNLTPFPADLEYSKFELLSLIAPVHVEYGISDNWAVGLGAFAGFKMVSTQRYEYDLNGKFLEAGITRSFNTHNFLYGLSAYFGRKNLKLNVRYNINPIFKDSDVNGNNLSVSFLIGY